jgi:hypothetical protein
MTFVFIIPLVMLAFTPSKFMVGYQGKKETSYSSANLNDI